MTDYAIEMYDITKIYSNLYANNNITLKVKKGEIHGIIGENGAGKSTLMSILFGLVKPTSGYILVNGKEKKIKNALDAEKQGIGMVHQHFKLVDIYNAIENIVLGREPNTFGFINYKKAKKLVQKIIDTYKFDINLKVPVDQLTVGQQQKIEILKLLYRNSNILIFDEPTGVLTPQEIEEFLKLLLHFKSMGKTIILISHKLNEIKSVCDTATIIKRGKVVDVIKVKNTSIEKMSSLMVGASLKKVKNTRKSNKNAKVLFSVSNINRKATSSSMKLENISFEIKEGEILAIAGVEGNGQTELINIITGLEKYETSKARKLQLDKPSIKLDNTELIKFSIKQKYEVGLSHIPEDRHKYGLILNSELRNSMFLQEYNKTPFAKNGFLVDKEINDWTNMLIKNFDIRGANHGNAMAGSLSGGNQQKAILAREITRKNKVIIIAQPTRGLDIGAINNVHKAILKERAKKKAILLISYELPEIFALADRILVISSGQISNELDPAKTSFKEIGLLMAGNKNSTIKKEKKTPIKRRVVLRKKIMKKIKSKKTTKISASKTKSPSNTKTTKIRYIIQKSPNHTGWELKKRHAKKATFTAKTKAEIEDFYSKQLKNAEGTILVEKLHTGKIQTVHKTKKPISVKKRDK